MLELARKIDQPKTLQVGFIDTTYPDGTPVAMVALWNEYGTPNAKHPIPPRPFFRTMIANKSGEWPDGIAAKLKDSNYDVDETLNQVGKIIEGQLRDSIINGGWAGNKASTIARKGFDRPLQDTEHMVNSITHKIKTS